MMEKWKKRKHAALSVVLSLAMALSNAMVFPQPQMQKALAAGNEVHIYADTPGDEKSAKYTLTANGTSVPVVKYSRNGNNFDIARFASADAAPEYTV